jgi:hypothetical protein
VALLPSSPHFTTSSYSPAPSFLLSLLPLSSPHFTTSSYGPYLPTFFPSFSLSEIDQGLDPDVANQQVTAIRAEGSAEGRAEGGKGKEEKEETEGSCVCVR